MRVFLLYDRTPDEPSIIAIYKTKTLALKAKRSYQGEAGDSYKWQYLEVEQRTVKEKI